MFYVSSNHIYLFSPALFYCRPTWESSLKETEPALGCHEIFFENKISSKLFTLVSDRFFFIYSFILFHTTHLDDSFSSICSSNIPPFSLFPTFTTSMFSIRKKTRLPRCITKHDITRCNKAGLKPSYQG